MRLRIVACVMILCAASATAQHGSNAKAKEFAAMIHEAMLRMNHGMMGEPLSGDPDQDFVQMMIPHHRGAIDMSKALLRYGKDRELQQLAKSIVAEQQSEIQLMQLWQARHSPRNAARKDHE
jgi:uncharacterized protein (DUF305 family)